MPPIHDTDLFGNEIKVTLPGELAKKFMVPPFTVLNAREGWWQDRKRAWVNLGIRSELGRGSNVLDHGTQSGNVNYYRLKRDLETEMGKKLTSEEANRILIERGLIEDMRPSLNSGAGRGANLLGMSPQLEEYRKGKKDYTEAELERKRKDATPGGGGGPNTGYNRGAKKPTARAFNMGINSSKETNWSVHDNLGSGTSIFDPVLCELLYEWFSPPGGQVVDPFSGGSVRGIVAASLGRKYWGCDLSAEQVAANKAQMNILPKGAPQPVWNVGDSAVRIDEAPEADFVLACPPYFDLEVYSEDPKDLSTMTWEGFRDAYAAIIAGCVERMKPNSFAAFVIGDVRGPDGTYWDLPGLTTRAFKRAGAALYNELILVTAVGSLSIRTERQFFMSRKLGRTHQTVLVYTKGDPKLAVDAISGMSYVQRKQYLDDQAEARRTAVTKWEESD